MRPGPFIAAATAALVFLTATFAWWALRDDPPPATVTEPGAGGPASPADRPPVPSGPITFTTSLEEKVFLKQIADAGGADNFAGNDLGLLNHGREACGLGPRDASGAIGPATTEAPTVDSLIRHRPDGVQRNAIVFLCPEHMKLLLQAHMGFAEGAHEVRSKATDTAVTPGLYRTATSRTGCVWQRLDKARKVIAEGTADGYVTVRIKPGDGYFLSTACGNWGLVHK